MKKLVLLLGILMMAQTAIATPGYDPALDTGPKLYDNSAYVEYCTKLEEDFDEKYLDPKTGNYNYPIGAYTREVRIPKLDGLKYFPEGTREYLEEQEKKSK